MHKMYTSDTQLTTIKICKIYSHDVVGVDEDTFQGIRKGSIHKKNICQHSRVLTATISETTCNMIIERSLYQYINSEATCLPIKRD